MCGGTNSISCSRLRKPAMVHFVISPENILNVNLSEFTAKTSLELEHQATGISLLNRELSKEAWLTITDNPL
ncbi:unnamed protein product [Pleuronectes platessa]|uniref:Uncharacterized protein n=1 Tax=Pleuronectes platessa TaxID=8262 RepID=A0A9N7YAQ1_PLEPL|nr:unnamed protein product [Pleuronectes platessa]